MSTQRITKKRRRQVETCIQCRSSRKQCDKGNPCRNCSENNRKCIYAKEFPYPNLSQEQQAAILERLLYDAKGKYDLLTSYIKKSDLTTTNWESQVVLANNKRHFTRNIRMEADMVDSLRQQTAARLVTISAPGEPEWQVQERVYHATFDRNPRLLALIDGLGKETMPPLPRSLESSEFSIDIARAMVSVEEVEMLVALYNDCYSFSSLPDFINPNLEENGDYDLLLSSVMTLMLSHAVNLHAMKVDNHQHLSHAFYHYTRDLLTTRMQSLSQPDIMCLHATFNLMLYEAENGYLDEASLSRQSMAIMIDSLHNQYPTMTVWQQNLLRQLFWAIFTADASRHNLQMQTHVICSQYMQVDKQRPSEHCAQPVDRLKEEYIYYRCRLADIIRHIDDICYKRSSPSPASPTPPPPSTEAAATPSASSSPSSGSSSSSSSSTSFSPSDQSFSSGTATSDSGGIKGQHIKMLEDELWDLYHELPGWVTDGQPLESVDLTQHHGYYGHPSTRPTMAPCMNCHPVCKRTLDEVWLRRLRYHFLVEWHGTFLYLYQVFLPQPGEIIQLPFMRCFEHGQLMVDVLTKWADDPDFFDCYCYPALRSLLVASHIHRYLLKSDFDDIRNKGYELLLNLFSVIQRSNIYHLYKDTAFILNIQQAFDQIRLDYLQSQRNIPVPSPVVDLGQFYPQGGLFGNGLAIDDDDAVDGLYVYTATAS